MKRQLANRPRALVVDDHREARLLVRAVLEDLGYELLEASGAAEAIELLATHEFEIVVTDLRMPPGADGIEVLRALRARQPNAAAIVLTGLGGIADCVAAMRAGANDFVAKPFHVATFVDVVRRSVDSMRLPRMPAVEPAAGNRSPPTAATSLLGASPSITEVLRLIEQIAPSRSTVLVTGETGTGKEVAARLIHCTSSRSGGPFVAVNCGAIPPSLIESELFGHARGAFTGATERRAGHFAQAHNGILFLDEIGELPLRMQVCLLRVLQTREVQAIGDTKSQPVDIRIVAATNRDLPSMVKDGRFREDLFYRLNVVHLELPPLRARTEDIAVLFRVFVDRSAALVGREVAVSAEVLSALRCYAWPGNVRELENLAERMVIFSHKDTLTIDELPDDIRVHAAHARTDEIRSIAETGLILEQTLEATERKLVDEALRRSRGNKTQAAHLLGINRTTLTEKLKRRGSR